MTHFASAGIVTCLVQLIVFLFLLIRKEEQIKKDEQYARCIWRYQIGFCFDSYQDNVLKFWISLTKCGLDMFPLADEITIRPWCIVEELKIRYTVRFVVNTATSTVH